MVCRQSFPPPPPGPDSLLEDNLPPDLPCAHSWRLSGAGWGLVNRFYSGPQALQVPPLALRTPDEVPVIPQGRASGHTLQTGDPAQSCPRPRREQVLQPWRLFALSEIHKAFALVSIHFFLQLDSLSEPHNPEKTWVAASQVP